MSQHKIVWCVSYRRAAKALVSLCSPDPSLLAYSMDIKILGSNIRISNVVPIDSCPCTFKAAFTYMRLIQKDHELSHM